MTYLIDTDVMVDFFKHRDPAKGLLEKLSQNATLLTFPYRDFSEYACGLADGTP